MSTLADRQAALVAALAGRAGAPAGFDAGRLHAAAQALAAKRRHAVAQRWPAVASLLGRAFAGRFDLFAAHHPMPADGGPLADGRAFVRWLDGQTPLDDAVRRQALDTDVRFTSCDGDRLLPRRRPCVRVARWPESRQWAMACHWPGRFDWFGRLRG